MRVTKVFVGSALIGLSLILCGCIGAIQTTAVDAEGAGGLTPTQEDKDAGLVGMTTGFNLKCVNFLPTP